MTSTPSDPAAAVESVSDDLAEDDEAAEDRVIEGVVKWYSLAKGFGFVAADGVDGDIFIHHSLLDEREDLIEGDRVRVRFRASPKGLQATSLESL